MTEGLGGYTHSWHSLLIDAVDDPYSRRPQAPKFTGERAAVTGAIAIADLLVGQAEKVFWYWSPWEGSGSRRPDRYTWFEYDGQLKPHAAAYAVSAHFLDGTRPVQRTMSRDGLVAAVFERDGSAVAVLRTKGDQPDIPVNLPDPATQPDRPLRAFDLMGNPLRPPDGRLAVGPHPVYVTADKCRGKALLARLGVR